MSDLSILSFHYDESATLCEKINRAIVVVKRVRYQLPNWESVTTKQLENARIDLYAAIKGILIGLGEVEQGIVKDKEHWKYQPSIIQLLKDRHKGEIVHYLEDLKNVKQKLESNTESLLPKELILLDEIGLVTSLDVTLVFRRIWEQSQ